jgi:hypothetical protein
MPESTASIVLRLKDEASKGLKTLNKEIGTFSGVLKGLTVAAGAVAGVGTAIGLMAAKGEDIRTMRNAFMSLAATVDQSGHEMVTAMRDASEGLISDFTLVKQANKILAAGLPVTSDQLGQLAIAAKRVGIGVGRGAAPAFEAFTTAIATGRTTQLAQMGLLIDSIKVIEDYADSLGIPKDELTEVQEKTALFNAVLKTTGERMEQMGNFSVGFGGQVDQLKTSIVNFKDQLFTFTSAFGDAFIESFKVATGIQIEFGRRLEFNAKTIGEFTKTALMTMVDVFILVAGTVTNLLDLFNVLQFVLGALATSIIKLGKNIVTFFVDPINLALKGAKLLAQALGREELAESIGQVSSSLLAVKESFDAAADATTAWAMQGLSDIESNRESLDKLSDAAANVRAAIGTIEVADIETNMNGVASGAAAAAASIKDELAPGLEASAEAAENIASAVKDTTQAAGDVQIGLTQAGDAGFKFGETSLDVLKGGAGGIVDTILTAFADSTGLIGQIIVGAIQILKEPGTLQAIIQSIFTAVLGAPKFLTDLTGFLVKALPIFVRELIGTMIPELITSLPLIIAELIILTPLIMAAVVEGLIALFTPSNWMRITAALWPLLAAQFNETVNESFKRPLEQFRETANQVFDFLSAQVLPVMSNAFSAVSEEINAWWQRTVWKDLTEGLGAILSDLAAQFDEMITQPFVNAVAESWQGFADGIQGVWEQTFGLLPAIAEDVGKTIAGPLGRVADQLSGISIGGDGGGAIGGLLEQATGISFQQGTPFVPRTMQATIHRGEAVIPAAQNPFAGGGGFGDVNISFGNIVLAPGSTERQAEEFIEIVTRNIRGAGDEIRRVVNRQG